MRSGFQRGIQRVAEDGQDLVDHVALGVRFAHEPRLARVRFGHRAPGVHSAPIASYRSWSVFAQSRYSDGCLSVNMIPNMQGWPVNT